MRNRLEPCAGRVSMRRQHVGSQENSYGKEFILDLHGCDVTKFTRPAIERFCEELCELI